MALPLTGINVVEMAQIYFGPGAAAYLADQGAEVIKVESPAGDQNRHRPVSPSLVPHGLSKPFLSLNRNKRAIALDARTGAGHEILRRLAVWADVFIHNLPPGSEQALGAGYETLAAANPRLIYASVSAYGRLGPDAHLPGMDLQLQARSGVLARRRTEAGAPIPLPVYFSDLSGCMALAYAVMLALWQRERTGRGQQIETSLLNTALAMQMESLVWVEHDDTPLPGEQPTAFYTSYQCADGEWLTVIAMQDHQWQALCRVLELDHLGGDPRFATLPARLEHSVELYQVLEAMFRSRPRAEWLERLRAARVPSAAVVERTQVPDDPQVAANAMLWEQDHPAAGTVRMVAPPFRLSASRDEPRLRRGAPLLGQHTDEILRELGYDPRQIGRLHEEGTVH